MISAALAVAAAAFFAAGIILGAAGLELLLRSYERAVIELLHERGRISEHEIKHALYVGNPLVWRLTAPPLPLVLARLRHRGMVRRMGRAWWAFT